MRFDRWSLSRLLGSPIGDFDLLNCRHRSVIVITSDCYSPQSAWLSGNELRYRRFLRQRGIPPKKIWDGGFCTNSGNPEYGSVPVRIAQRLYTRPTVCIEKRGIVHTAIELTQPSLTFEMHFPVWMTVGSLALNINCHVSDFCYPTLRQQSGVFAIQHYTPHPTPLAS